MSVGKQVVSIWATGNGYLDDVPVPDAKRFETELVEYFETRHPDLLNDLRDNNFSDDIVATMKSGVESFKQGFVPSEEVEEEEHVTMENLDTLSDSTTSDSATLTKA